MLPRFFEKIPFYVALRDFVYQRYISYLKVRFPKKYADILFFQTFGKNINWKNPQDLNEIINYLAFCSDTSQWTRLADKFNVRNFVKESGCEEILIPLLGHWHSADEIDFSILPNQFVLKSNHGSGDVIIVKDKSTLDLDQIRNKISKALLDKFGLESAEPHYLKIKPIILAEKYIEPQQGKIVDYKIWCFNGKPYYVFTGSNRNVETHSVDFALYDLNWQRHDEYMTTPFKNNTPVKKPTRFNDMLNYARKLSKGFPQVRVDFYEIDGNIFFGEMTFTSQCGRMDYFTSDFLKIMGQKVSF